MYSAPQPALYCTLTCYQGYQCFVLGIILHSNLPAYGPKRLVSYTSDLVLVESWSGDDNYSVRGAPLFQPCSLGAVVFDNSAHKFRPVQVWAFYKQWPRATDVSESSAKQTNAGGRNKVVDGLHGLVGNTPLVRIKSLSEETGCEVWVHVPAFPFRKDIFICSGLEALQNSIPSW